MIVKIKLPIQYISKNVYYYSIFARKCFKNTKIAARKFSVAQDVVVEKTFALHIENLFFICYYILEYYEKCSFRALSEENIMSPKQYKKVKLYRALKILFYCCGLPLFVLAVFCTAVKFIGHDPFNGEATFTNSLNMMQSYERTLSGSSLFGVWSAFAIWLIIAVFQIIFAKTIKNRRARMFATVAITLVLMMGALLAVDTVYERKIDGFTNPINGTHTDGMRDELQTKLDLFDQFGEDEPDGKIIDALSGITMEDYRTQLSYYRTISTEAYKKDMTKKLIDKIDLLKRVYNVEMEGKDKIGSAGSVSNDPITYATIISDEGKMGVDISFKDGKLALTEENKREVEHKALLGGSTGYVVDNNVIVPDDETGTGKNWKWGTDLPIYWDPSQKDYLNRQNKLCQEAEQLVRLCPNDKGQLVINGEVYSHYVAVSRTALDGKEYYAWYAKDLYPENYDFEKQKGVVTDGVYGKAIYNKNGNIADGWIFSFENVLEILEDYYEAPVMIDVLSQQNKLGDFKTLHATTMAEAAERRLEYYTAETTDPWERALYKQETYYANKFSFTHYRLDALIAEVGKMIGNNNLFRLIFSEMKIADIDLEPFLGEFRTGVKIIAKFMSDEVDGVKVPNATGETVLGILRKIANDDSLQDIFVKLAYPAEEENGHFIITIMPNGGERELTAAERGTYTGKRYSLVDDKYVESSQGNYKKSGSEYIELTAEEKGTYTGKRYTYDEDEKEYVEDGRGTHIDCIPIIDIDFSNELKKYQEENPDFAFDLDHLSEFLNNTLNRLITLPDIVGTVVGVAGGLISALDTTNGVALNITLLGSNVHIQLLDANNKFAFDIDEILLTLLDGLYYYESSAIQPLWNFYVDPEETSAVRIKIAEEFAAYDRAEFTGTKYGSLIGSTLIGKTLGATMAMSGGISYDSKYGLTDLASVIQLKTDLSYMPYFFPIYAFRDMVALFAGMVVVMVFLSYFAAEKEYLYATGHLIPKEKKKDKKGKNSAQEAQSEDGAQGAPEGAENAENKEPNGEEQPELAPPEDEEKPKKKPKKEKKSKKAKGEPEAEEGADVPVQENSDKEVR